MKTGKEPAIKSAGTNLLYMFTMFSQQADFC